MLKKIKPGPSEDGKAARLRYFSFGNANSWASVTSQIVVISYTFFFFPDGLYDF